MIWRYGVIGLSLLAVLAGCQGTEMAHEQEATTAGAVTGADDDPSAEDASGDLGGELPDVGEFRDPRFGRKGLRR